MSEEPTICHKCNEVIVNRIISAMGKNWHPDHFTCKDCDRPITETSFNISEDRPICTDCFYKNHTTLCYGCNTHILERTIKALGNSWHETCFRCAGKCGLPMMGKSFYERDGKPYCREDFEELFAPRCAGCTKPIVENAIVALSVKWHRECFKCKKCQKPITESSFAVEDALPLCAACSG